MQKLSKRLLLFCAVVIFLGSLTVLAQREPVPMRPGAEEKPVVAVEAEKTVVKKRIREGTTFQGKRVFFRPTGSRTTLYTVEENERYVCLENLNLERILTAMEEKPGRGVWKIDGTFTEFRGENFVLITRAVVAPEDFRPTPPQTFPKGEPKEETPKK